MQPKLFVVMRLGSAVVLSYLDAGFEARCGLKDFFKRPLVLVAMVPKCGWKTAHFHLKMDHRVAPRRGTRLIEHPFAIL